ncbi:glyoxylate/hydroxypyruvate reductase A [Marinomonas sp. GJ51-6]|uniref:2-hydroxyacid dehydrogenase n=1 Tax=Marinomonas sp. GJ51-6 TaxID=2992802 RepID=UPI0029345E86|nr:glyoxylate/hydroxypyruvate reductase A [Marinomonas sp. GJ51-6]WOD06080.1 glyoxylate/hydroxypyruvate reductase A [Marinomonas sp. GJ51-6]
MPLPILLASNDSDFAQDVKAEFQAQHPDVDVYLLGEASAEQALLAACWRPPATLLKEYPNLKVLHALSAGADHLSKDLLTSGLPVCRIVDNEQKHGMLEYILWGILNHQRDFELYRNQQAQQTWQTAKQRYTGEIQITLLGLGEIGSYVAQQLAQFGYKVNGWNRSLKNIPGVSCFDSNTSLDPLLAETDVLVNLLPLTQATKGILSKSLLDKLPPDSYLINCGRGGHMITDDLIDAVESGHLKGALLDVFDEEPLPNDNPLWSTKGIVITPHIASSSSYSTIVNQVVENMALFESGKPLKNLI